MTELTCFLLGFTVTLAIVVVADVVIQTNTAAYAAK